MRTFCQARVRASSQNKLRQNVEDSIAYEATVYGIMNNSKIMSKYDATRTTGKSTQNIASDKECVRTRHVLVEAKLLVVLRRSRFIKGLRTSPLFI